MAFTLSNNQEFVELRKFLANISNSIKKGRFWDTKKDLIEIRNPTMDLRFEKVEATPYL